MTVRSLWSSIPKNFKLPILWLSGMLFALIALYLINYWQYRQLKPGSYQPSAIIWLESPTTAKTNEAVKFRWQISAPTPRSAARTALYWGETSTTSASLADPKDSPYPNHSSDYLAGPFNLPQDFEVRFVPDEARVYYLRAYAQVDNQHLWSQEIKLVSKN